MASSTDSISTHAYDGARNTFSTLKDQNLGLTERYKRGDGPTVCTVIPFSASKTFVSNEEIEILLQTFIEKSSEEFSPDDRSSAHRQLMIIIGFKAHHLRNTTPFFDSLAEPLTAPKVQAAFDTMTTAMKSDVHKSPEWFFRTAQQGAGVMRENTVGPEPSEDDRFDWLSPVVVSQKLKTDKNEMWKSMRDNSEKRMAAAYEIVRLAQIEVLNWMEENDQPLKPSMSSIYDRHIPSCICMICLRETRSECLQGRMRELHACRAMRGHRDAAIDRASQVALTEA